MQGWCNIGSSRGKYRKHEWPCSSRNVLEKRTNFNVNKKTKEMFVDGADYPREEGLTACAMNT